ncbi:endonuclease III [bacterium]|nr:endonuclease III [bacterium]
MEQDIGEKLQFITRKLELAFGCPVREKASDLLEVLIRTILSQNTNDRNRDRAYENLRQQFSTWQQVMQAPVEAISSAIRAAGLSNQKGKRIKEILQWIHSNLRTLDISEICQWPPQQVIETFCRLPGIGIKTISVVLLFGCGHDIFPVDTHIHRISKRVGLITSTTSAEKAHQILGKLIPPGKAYSLHLNLLQLGRTICLARNPLCAKCPIGTVCNFGQKLAK